MIRRKLIAVVAATAMVAMIQTAQASSTDTLADLASGKALTIGDKIFTNFSFNASGLSVFDASLITVTVSYDSAGVYYLTYDGTMSYSGANLTTADLALNYTVIATSGLISLVDQKYTGSGVNGILSVDETVTSSSITASSHVDTGFGLNGSFVIGQDTLITIDPAQSSLVVNKDIVFGVYDLTGASASGTVTVYEVLQSFHQVPEPSTVALLLLGAGALWLRKKHTA
jgi:hypothetical protein